MSKKSIDSNLLFEAMGDIKDEWIEEAVEYKRTSKIFSFPYYRYVNVAAALVICIISVSVFIRLKPINEIDVPVPTETISATVTPDAPDDDITSTSTPLMEVTDEPSASVSPVVTNTPDVEISSEPIVSGTNNPVVITTDEPEMTNLPAGPTRLPIETYKPSATNVPVGPTRLPIETNTPSATKVPVGPSKAPIIVTNKPDVTNAPFKPTTVPIVVTKVPEPTKAPVLPTNVPVITTEPPVVIKPTEAITNPPVVITETPVVKTPEPTDRPYKTPEPKPSETESAPGIDPSTSPSIWPQISAIPTDPPATKPASTVAPNYPYWINEGNANVYAVEGSDVVVDDLNGAVQNNNDPNGPIYTFTDENAKQRTGIKIQNPILNNEDYIHNYGYLRQLKKDGLTNVFDLAGSRLYWDSDGDKLPMPTDIPDYGKDDIDSRVWYVAKENEIYYPVPRNLKGFSMSFWSKTNKADDTSSILVIANTNRTISVSVNAVAKFTDSIYPSNLFSTSQDLDNPDYKAGQWHYYTITIANDWITVYIDGVEVKYDYVELNKKKITYFNDGFLTRYNPAVTWTAEDYKNDWRGYLSYQSSSNDLYPTLTSDNYSVFGNGRYRGIGSTERLMLTFMTGDTTDVYIGGAVVEAGSSSAKYNSQTGSQVAQVKYYLDELTYEQVYANYLLAEEPVER